MIHYDKREVEGINGYEDLANAIIIQAVKDYRKAIKAGASGQKRALEKFFLSEWFTVLTKTDGARLINDLKMEGQ